MKVKGQEIPRVGIKSLRVLNRMADEGGVRNLRRGPGRNVMPALIGAGLARYDRELGRYVITDEGRKVLGRQVEDE